MVTQVAPTNPRRKKIDDPETMPQSAVWLLLPAYNEENSLNILLQKIKEVSDENHIPLHVIACDDGSTDKTRHILLEHQATLDLEIIVHKINRGLGETVRDLFEKADEVSEPDDIIVRMDCDDTHDPSLIPLMIGKLSEGYDVVIASRFQPGGGQIGVAGVRALLSRAANVFMKLLFPIKGIQEYSCGYRAYRASIIKQALEAFANDFIQLKGLGFTCTLEKLVKLKMLGARFGEVPFVLRYDLKRSKSKMVVNITTLGYLTLGILYYWPWNGWRNHYKNLLPRAVNGSSSFDPKAVSGTPSTRPIDVRHEDTNGH